MANYIILCRIDILYFISWPFLQNSLEIFSQKPFRLLQKWPDPTECSLKYKQRNLDTKSILFENEQLYGFVDFRVTPIYYLIVFLKTTIVRLIMVMRWILDHHTGTEALLNSMEDGGKDVRIFAHATFKDELLKICTFVKNLNCTCKVEQEFFFQNVDAFLFVNLLFENSWLFFLLALTVFVRQQQQVHDIYTIIHHFANERSLK